MTRRRTLDGLEGLPSTIGGESPLVRNLSGSGNYLVRGEVHGDCDVDGAIMLTLSCHWIGNVTADVLVIKGRVDGNVSARFKLELRPTAQVTGNLSSPLIALGQGAVVRGAISRDSVVTRFQERRTH